MTRIIGALFCVALALSGSACATDPAVRKHRYVQSGDRYVAAQKYPEAIVEYRNAIQVDPRDGAARTKLAEAYEAHGDLSNAYREYIRAADLVPDPQVQIKAGQMLLLGRQYEDAIGRADRALEDQTSAVDARLIRAAAFTGLNRLDEAEQEIEKAIELAPERSEAHTAMGSLQLVRNEREKARAAFEKAVELEREGTRAKLALAGFHVANGEPDAAERHLIAVLDVDASNLPASRLLASLYLSTGRSAAAEPHLKVVAAQTKDGSGTLRLAEYYLQMNRQHDARSLLESLGSGDSPRALDAKLRLATLPGTSREKTNALLDEILRRDARHTNALITRAELRLNERRFEEALADARAAVQAGSSGASGATAHYVLGRVHLARREPGEAIGAFTHAIAANPSGMAGAEIELAGLHLAAGKLDLAEQAAKRAVDKAPSASEALLMRARVHVARREIQPAAALLRVLSEKFPATAALHTEIGALALAQGDRARARAAFELALAKDPNHLAALIALSRLDLADRRTDLAVRRLEAAILRNPQQSRLWMLAAAVHTTAGELTQAEDALLRAIAIDPHEPDAYGQLARLYHRQGRVREAITQMDRQIAQQPDRAGPYIVAGMLLQMQNRTQEARARYERAIELDARAAVAANNLAWIYAEDGSNLDVALQLARQAKALLPDSASVSDTLGWVYHRKGLSANAVTALREAVEQAPDNPQHHFHLGVALSVAGETIKARDALSRAVSLAPDSEPGRRAREALKALPG